MTEVTSTARATRSAVFAVVLLVIAVIGLAATDIAYQHFTDNGRIDVRRSWVLLGYLPSFVVYAAALAFAGLHLIGQFRRVAGWVPLALVVAVPFAYGAFVRPFLSI